MGCYNSDLLPRDRTWWFTALRYIALSKCQLRFWLVEGEWSGINLCSTKPYLGWRSVGRDTLQASNSHRHQERQDLLKASLALVSIFWASVSKHNCNFESLLLSATEFQDSSSLWIWQEILLLLHQEATMVWSHHQNLIQDHWAY